MTRARPTVSLAHVIGAVLRAYREQSQPPCPIDAIARRMREHGHPWTKATLLSIEHGRRELALGEWLVLLDVLGMSSYQQLLDQCLPDAYRMADVVLGPALSIQGHALAALLDHRHPDYEQFMRSPKLDRIRTLNAPATVKVTTWMLGDAERQAAARLGLTPAHVGLRAHRRWGQSLTEKRDAVLAADPANAALSPAARQRKLGHITRKLVRKLFPRTRMKKPPRTRKR